MDRSLRGSSIHGILQARILEWVAISFSRGSSWPRDRTRVAHIASRCGRHRGSSSKRAVLLFFPGSIWNVVPEKDVLYQWINKDNHVLSQFQQWNILITVMIYNVRYFRMDSAGEFLGDPVVKTLCFHGRGCGFAPRLGTKILHAVRWNQKRKTDSVFGSRKGELSRLAPHVNLRMAAHSCPVGFPGSPPLQSCPQCQQEEISVFSWKLRHGSN